MMDRDEDARNEILARLAQSRQELRRLLDPPRGDTNNGGATQGAHSGGFPRSRTMQALMSSRGLGVVGAVAGGLFLARPALAFRVLRMLPASAVARTVILRAIAALRSNATRPSADRGGE
jgi:hypothetical protein